MKIQEASETLLREEVNSQCPRQLNEGEKNTRKGRGLNCGFFFS